MNDECNLLAVDIGLRFGLAMYSRDGRLLNYASKHASARSKLKQMAYSICSDYPNLTHLVLEGGGEHFIPWEKVGLKKGLEVIQVSAEMWRKDLLHKREQRSGKIAKGHADTIARELIEQAGIRRPTSLRHDAAEAILVGHWAVLELGWSNS